MALAREHEILHRRSGRNIGVGLTLVAFIVVIFVLTIAKVQNGGPVEGFDHTFRPGLAEQAQ